MKAGVQLMASSAVTLLLVTGMSVLTAYGLGPEEFGLYAAAQAVAVVLMPLVSLRLETRIAVCTTDEALSELVTAVTTVAGAFLMVAGLLALLAGVWTASLSYALVALLSAGMVIADLGLARLAFKGEHGTLAVLRLLRQVLPVAMALAVTQVLPQHQPVLAALVVGTWVWALVLGWPRKNQALWSWGSFRRVWREHHAGLKASVALGGLNGLWLNGLQPLMAWLGWHQLAGQFALLQRLINAPLGVLTVVVNTFLLAKGNALHESRSRVLQVCAGLALVGAAWVACLWGLLFVQTYWALPEQWVPDEGFFHAAALFGVCSFAVGTVSVISIRLRDEWFVAAWQLLFMLAWMLALYVADLEQVFSGLLLMGGLAYGVLLWRWISLIPAQKG